LLLHQISNIDRTKLFCSFRDNAYVSEQYVLKKVMLVLKKQSCLCNVVVNSHSVKRDVPYHKFLHHFKVETNGIVSPYPIFILSTMSVTH